NFPNSGQSIATSGFVEFDVMCDDTDLSDNDELFSANSTNTDFLRLLITSADRISFSGTSGSSQQWNMSSHAADTVSDLVLRTFRVTYATNDVNLYRGATLDATDTSAT